MTATIELTETQVEVLDAAIREVIDNEYGKVIVVIRRGAVVFIRTETGQRVFEAANGEDLEKE